MTIYKPELTPTQSTKCMLLNIVLFYDPPGEGPHVGWWVAGGKLLYGADGSPAIYWWETADEAIERAAAPHKHGLVLK